MPSGAKAKQRTGSTRAERNVWYIFVSVYRMGRIYTKLPYTAFSLAISPYLGCIFSVEAVFFCSASQMLQSYSCSATQLIGLLLSSTFIISTNFIWLKYRHLLQWEDYDWDWWVRSGKMPPVWRLSNKFDWLMDES